MALAPNGMYVLMRKWAPYEENDRAACLRNARKVLRKAESNLTEGGIQYYGRREGCALVDEKWSKNARKMVEK